MPRALMRTTRRHRRVLIETWQRRVEAAREPERPGAKEPLCVVQVPKHFTNAPLARRVAFERLLLRDLPQLGEHVDRLGAQRIQDVALDQIDVREVVRRGFRAVWYSDHH